MKTPLVSVIIPMYNAEKTIEKCLISIFNQTYKNFEILIVDDGSTDNSCEIIKDMKRKEINLVRQKNAGPSKARNMGISIATGVYIAFLDSDDEWFPSKLEEQLKVFESDTSIGMVACCTTLKKKIRSEKVQKITLFGTLTKNSLATSSILVRKEILKKVGFFDETMKYSEDIELWLRILIETNVVLLNMVLIKYEFGNGLTSNFKGMFKGVKRILDKLLKKRVFSKYRVLNLCIFLYFYIFEHLKYIRRIIKKNERRKNESA